MKEGLGLAAFLEAKSDESRVGNVMEKRGSY
jgi:hypothetical protein